MAIVFSDFFSSCFFSFLSWGMQNRTLDILKHVPETFLTLFLFFSSQFFRLNQCDCSIVRLTDPEFLISDLLVSLLINFYISVIVIFNSRISTLFFFYSFHFSAGTHICSFTTSIFPEHNYNNGFKISASYYI